MEWKAQYPLHICSWQTYPNQYKSYHGINLRASSSCQLFLSYNRAGLERHGRRLALRRVGDGALVGLSRQGFFKHPNCDLSATWEWKRIMIHWTKTGKRELFLPESERESWSVEKKTGKRERLLRLGGFGGRDARFPARLAAHLRSLRLHTGA